MSTNLRLALVDIYDDETVVVAACSLLQTPSSVTAKILTGKRRKGEADDISAFVNMSRYFKWLDEHSVMGEGEKLDHKLAVATFLVKHPFASWYAQ